MSTAEAYLDFYQIPRTELFGKIANGFQQLTIFAKKLLTVLPVF